MSLETELLGLAKSGYLTLTFEYNGAGDSGSIEDIQAFDGKELIAIPRKEVPSLLNWVWDEIIEQSGDFNEINEGSYGTITIDLKTLEASYETTERINESDSERLMANKEGLEDAIYYEYDKAPESIEKLMKEHMGQCIDGNYYYGIQVLGDSIYLLYSYETDGGSHSNEGINLPDLSEHTAMLLADQSSN